MSDRESQDAQTEEPRVSDTYSAAYAFIVLFLLPGVALLSRLHFGDDRAGTYTFGYVSLVTVPFLLGLVATFMTDHTDGWRKAAIRTMVLVPLIVLTGVTIMTVASMIMVPLSKLAGAGVAGRRVAWWAGLVVVIAPLVVSLVRRLRRPAGVLGGVQLVAIGLVLALAAGLAVVSFILKLDVYGVLRKDVVIYVVGALSWYAPSFGLAAGLWRRSGLV